MLMFEISVAEQLVKQKTVKYEGCMLTMTSCEMQASKSDLNFSITCDQSACSSDSSFVIKQGDLSHSCSAVPSSVNTEDYSDIITNWWHTSDCSGTDSVNSDYSSQSRELRSYKDLTNASEEDTGDDVMYEKPNESAVESSCEPLVACSKHCVSEENQCQKISFVEEKLRLIYKQILSSQMEFRAEVRVKLDKHLVKISGSNDDVRDTEMKLHEVVSSFVSAGISISETSAKLLSTKSGEDWLDLQLANEHLVAVFYIKDAEPMIMTDCQDRLIRVKHVIESSLITKCIPVEQLHIKLMQSAIWIECIENLQSTLLLRISMDYGADMRLVVEGCVDDVKVALEKLGQMLGENSTISHHIQLKCGVYHVLCFRRSEIQQEAKYVNSLFDTELQNTTI